MRHVLLITVAVALFAGHPSARGESASQPDALAPLVAKLGDNAWMKLAPAREPAGRNYCAPCPGDGQIFYFGGDRQSHDGNDVELYSIRANTWTQSWSPALRPDPEIGQKELDAKSIFDAETGRLWPIRTYGQVCYLPKTKQFLYSGHAGTWLYDPANAKWTNTNGPHSPGAKPAPHTPLAWQQYHTFYSPQLEAAVCIVTARPFGVWVYNADTNEWTQRKNNIPPTMQWYELYSAWVPSLNAHLLCERGKPFMWLYDAKTETFTVVKDVPEALQGTQALAYDSANDMIVALAQYRAAPGNPTSKAVIDVWTIAPKTLAFTKLDRFETMPDGYATGSWSPLIYDAEHNVFVFLNRPKPTTAETWAYRYKRK